VFRHHPESCQGHGSGVDAPSEDGNTTHTGLLPSTTQTSSRLGCHQQSQFPQIQRLETRLLHSTLRNFTLGPAAFAAKLFSPGVNHPLYSLTYLMLTELTQCLSSVGVLKPSPANTCTKLPYSTFKMPHELSTAYVPTSRHRMIIKSCSSVLGTDDRFVVLGGSTFDEICAGQPLRRS
jgi:hypothetical protein